jgi:hypothetical protein
MTVKRVLLFGVLLAGLAGAVALSKEGESSGLRMTEAAGKLIDSLSDEQKDRAQFQFDAEERTNWNFVPLQKDKKPLRKGLRMDQMSAGQRDLTRNLLRAGTSPSGYGKATTIMSLESVLADLEKGGANVRDPLWYFVSIFGTPSKTGCWGWRIEGHHLSLNFVVDRGRVTAATPAFFGANPADIRSGDRKGVRTLPEAEDLARDLFAALDEEQVRMALQPKQFEEIEQGKAAAHVGKSVGLPAAKMNDKQRDILKRLLKGYTDRMPAEIGAAQLEEVEAAGVDKVHFAFAQEKDKPGKPYTYRIQGPSFVVEFLNVQADGAGNPANHIHSSWRNLPGDFGIPRP